MERSEGKKFIKMLNNAGYSHDRTRGGHMIFINPTKKHEISIPSSFNKHVINDAAKECGIAYHK